VRIDGHTGRVGEPARERVKAPAGVVDRDRLEREDHQALAV